MLGGLVRVFRVTGLLGLPVNLLVALDGLRVWDEGAELTDLDVPVSIVVTAWSQNPLTLVS